MSKKLLVVVDYQNDFVTGSLATVGSERFLPEIESLVKWYSGKFSENIRISNVDL